MVKEQQEYRVTKEDLKGAIAEFPLEVVQQMVNHQKEQGNKADVEVFIRKPDTSDVNGGFFWAKTIGGVKVWSQAINYHNFEPFYNTYGNKEENTKELVEVKVSEDIKDIDFMTGDPWYPMPYKTGDIIKGIDGNSVRSNRVFIGYAAGAPKPYLTISRKNFSRIMQGENTEGIRIIPYKELQPEMGGDIVKLTLEDISAGKGVGVPSHLIKIVKSK